MFRSLRKRWATALGAIALISTPALADNTIGLSRAEIASLQQRLTDAGCYSGAIDGAASAALDAAVKACPDQGPILRIETGMHTAAITGFGVDAACRTARDGVGRQDGAAVVAARRQAERTMRLPIGRGNGGKVYAVAVSPDGRLARGGRLGRAYAEDRNTASASFDLTSGAPSAVLARLQSR